MSTRVCRAYVRVHKVAAAAIWFELILGVLSACAECVREDMMMQLRRCLLGKLPVISSSREQRLKFCGAE